MLTNRIFLLLLSCLFIYSCASYDTLYKDPKATSEFPVNKEIEKTFYLVGDAGLSPMGGKSDALQTFYNYLKDVKTPGNYTIFLGDNIYPGGMDPEDDKTRPEAENMINAQYESVKDYDGPVYFIPGNHEWYNGGLAGVKREEDYVESKFKTDAFRPSNGCPLESISVSDNIQLIIIDTQWYLENWNIHPTINKNCDIKSREKLFIEIETELQQHQNKTIVFAMHHPMFTNGTHGGYFGYIKHIFPTQGNLPLPFLSSLVVQIRSQGGVSVQDRYNELYNNLMTKLASITKNSDRLVFASGHDHSLQYIEKDGLKQILSGAGAKTSGASLGKDGLFASGSEGFVVMDVFKDGSSWARYYGPDKNYEPKLLFQKELFPPTKQYEVKNLPENFSPTRVVPIYKQDSINESLFLKSVWGARYKETFSKPVTAKVAKLDTLYGGLSVIREGGQKEYRSLRLEDKNGNEYRMRALGKNSLDISQKIVIDEAPKEPGPKVEPDVPISSSFDVDFYTASHPYAVLAIPTLAKAINIFYTNSQLFYVPKQKQLRNYNENYGDELYLLSLEPTEKSEGEQTFKYPDDVQTTDDILTKLRKSTDIYVDEENYIKSRLFDMLIGDWDRESDHWRWAIYFNSYGKNVYVPIPKNRDDAFSSYDGRIFNIANSIFRGTRQTHVYDENLTDLEWFNKEGIILDCAILQRSGRNQWTYAAKIIQDSLTNTKIEEAFKEIPEEVRNEELQQIKEKLIARRDNLAEIADRYYTLLSNLQTITGTDNNDYIEITRLPEGKTNIRTFTVNDEKRSEVLTDRTYNHKDTREIWVYGLGGDDVFKVTGDDNDLIYIRVIGGHGEDRFIIENGRRVKFYDYDSSPALVEKNEKGSLIFSDIYDFNTYDYRKQITVTKRIGPAFGYNPDDGFRIGLQYIYTVDSFKRNPFSKRHTITAGYYFGTSSFDIDYNGEYANSIGDLNLSIGARISSPNYVVNYFGYGNETENNDDELGYDYNRVELQTISANIGLIKNSSFGSYYKFQTLFQAITLNNSANNLYQDKGNTTVDDTRYYGTAEGSYNYRSFDNPLNPAKGMVFDLSLGVTDNLNDIDNIFGYLKTKIIFYNALVKNEKLVLKTNVQAAFNFGNRFEFFQGVTAGADTGLRGFRNERFTGKSSLVGSADIRYAFNEFKIELFPVQIGIYGGADLGRVWTPEGDSQKWHNSRGGGLWINSQGGLGGTFSAFNSKEGTRYTFGVGFTF